MSGEVVGGYRLEGLLGRGGSGEVWRARGTGALGQVVAVKRLGPGAVDAGALRAEATVLAELDHPHVVRVFEVVDDGAGVAVVMQHARGGSLADLLAERERLTPGEVVAVVAPVADALASAHRRGLVHGDVKPANILFTSDGQPLLSDFGAARRSTDDDRPVAATEGFLAPEVAAGAAPSSSSDLYALGAVCHRALTGALPGEDGELPAGDALAALVGRALATDPADRQPDAASLAAELRSALPPDDIALPGTPAHVGGAVGPDTRTFGPRPPAPVEEPPRADRRTLAVVGLAALLAAVVAVVVWRTPGDDAPPPTTVAAPTVPPGCPPPAPPDGFDGDVVLGDLDGDGCPTAVVFDGAVMVVPAGDPGAEPELFRFATARAGDVLLLGDWDCDGADSPGFYRPGTGEAFEFDRLAGEGEEPLTALPRRDTGVIGGTPKLVTGGDGCDEIDADEQA